MNNIEAVKKILVNYYLNKASTNRQGRPVIADDYAQQICQLLPEGEPPLLSDRKIREIISEWEPFTVASAPQFGITKNIAQAQRDSDIKWMLEVTK